MSASIIHSKEKKREVYRNKNGDRIPSVTTLLNLRSKPQLDAWKSRLWKAGKDPKAEAARESERGKLMHSYCEAILHDTTLVIPDSVYSNDELDELGHTEILALSDDFSNFWKNMRGIGYELVGTEMVMVDEENGFGGTIDIMVCQKNRPSAVEIWDIKTGKDFYPEHSLQVAGGYSQLASANGYMVELCRIIRLPKLADLEANNKPESLTIHPKAIPAFQQEFMSLLCLYKASRYSESMTALNPSSRYQLSEFSHP